MTRGRARTHRFLGRRPLVRQYKGGAVLDVDSSGRTPRLEGILDVAGIFHILPDLEAYMRSHA